MILKVKPPYKSLIQMKWCCAACSVLWVLHRRGYWVDQEVIAKEFNVKIPPELKELFTVRLKTRKKKENCGATVLIERDSKTLNRFLKKYKIPLKCKTFLISDVKDARKLVIDNVKAGNDVLLSFCWKGLGINQNWGHVSVIAEFNTKTNEVTLGDPSPKRKKFWKIKLNKLTHAMLPKWDKEERGFYIFSKK